MRALFARLKLAHKLLICGAAFSVPPAVLLYYTVSGFERQIQLAGREMAGARALQPLCDLAILLGGRNPDGAATEGLIAGIRQAEAELGPLLPASAAANRRSLTDSNARRELARQAYAAFPRLAETAKLIVDPEPDAYYLADLVSLRLPGVHEALSRNPAAALDAGWLEAVRRTVSAAVAENRRKHPGGSALATRLPRELAAFETAGPASRLEAACALWKTGAAELAAILEQRAAALRRKELTALILTLAGVAFAGAMLFILVRNVSVPLARATRIAQNIAAGRLSAAEASLARPKMQKYLGSAEAVADGQVRDEAFRLLDSFVRMVKSLSSLLNEVRKSCAEVDGSTSQMAAGLRQLEAAVAQQAASTNEVAATSKEIFATVQELAQNMLAVTGMAAEAANLAGTGLADLHGINTAMQDILEGATAVSAVLNTISAKAANINCVLSAITNIANRTNLISLNAAIEAEKAGQHAAGFTVVGLEIRRVADQTAVAALDIEKMLGDMQAAVSEGARSMAAYAERSRGNSEMVAAITAGLSRSIECTRKLEPHFEAVNSGMQMQAEAARQILEAMQQLSGAADQTRDSLAQFREIADHMRATVNVLQAEMARFSVA